MVGSKRRSTTRGACSTKLHGRCSFRHERTRRANRHPRCRTAERTRATTPDAHLPTARRAHPRTRPPSLRSGSSSARHLLHHPAVYPKILTAPSTPALTPRRTHGIVQGILSYIGLTHAAPRSSRRTSARRTPEPERTRSIDPARTHAGTNGPGRANACPRTPEPEPPTDPTEPNRQNQPKPVPDNAAATARLDARTSSARGTIEPGHRRTEPDPRPPWTRARAHQRPRTLPTLQARTPRPGPIAKRTQAPLRTCRTDPTVAAHLPQPVCATSPGPTPATLAALGFPSRRGTWSTVPTIGRRRLPGRCRRWPAC